MAHSIVKEDFEEIVRALGADAHKFEGKTVLISGGSGFLGSYFLGTFKTLNDTVLKKPCRVISLDNYITGSHESIWGDTDDPHIRLVEADVTRPVVIDGPAHFIIHAAGIASPVYYQKYPLETIESAISGAKNLLELARQKNVESFLFFSSSEIYGDPDTNFIPTPETYKGNVSSTGPRACYDESKRLAETICMTYYRIYNIPVKIVRPFNVYGPGMKPNDYRVIPTFITKGLAGQELPVHENGNQTRTFCYISDAIIGFMKVLLLGKDGEVYNIGMDKGEINMGMLANLVSDLLASGVRATFINYPSTYPADEPKRRCPDLTKARTTLGYNPVIDLKTGILRTVRWYRDTFPSEIFEV